MVWDNDNEFKEYYDNHKDKLRRYLVRLSGGDQDTAEDLVQETFTRIYKHRHTFNPDKGPFQAWAYKIAYNVFLTDKRKKKETVEFDEEWVIESSSYTQNPHEGEQNVMLKEIMSALDNLPETEKAIIISRELKHYTLEETAAALNVSVRTISRRAPNAYLMARDELLKRGLTLEL